MFAKRTKNSPKTVKITLTAAARGGGDILSVLSLKVRLAGAPLRGRRTIRLTMSYPRAEDMLPRLVEQNITGRGTHRSFAWVRLDLDYVLKWGSSLGDTMLVNS